MVAAMDAVGVDGALLVSPWSMYRFDASYALEVYAQYPNRFGLIKPFDQRSPQLAEEIAAWAATPGVVGARLMLAYDATSPSDRAGIDRMLRAAAEHALPVNVLCWDELPTFEALATSHPNTRLVIDHLGLRQPFEPPLPSQPFADLDAVVSLARYDNVAIKITGACTLSTRSFPYEDIWPALTRLFEAYGLERCLWGTDWTRATAFLSYEQGVEAFRVASQLSASEREMLMGGSTIRIYEWQPKPR